MIQQPTYMDKTLTSTPLVVVTKSNNPHVGNERAMLCVTSWHEQLCLSQVHTTQVQFVGKKAWAQINSN